MRLKHWPHLLLLLVLAHTVSGQETYLADMPKPEPEYNQLENQQLITLKNGNKIVIAGYKKSLPDDDDLQSQSKVFISKVNACNQIKWSISYKDSVPINYRNNCFGFPIAAETFKAVKHRQSLYLAFEEQALSANTLNIHKMGLDGTVKWKREYALPAKVAPAGNFGTYSIQNKKVIFKDGQLFVVKGLNNCFDASKDELLVAKISRTNGNLLNKKVIQTIHGEEPITDVEKYKHSELVLQTGSRSLFILNDSLQVEKAFQVNAKAKRVRELHDIEPLPNQKLAMHGVFDTAGGEFVGLLNQNLTFEWAKALSKRYFYNIQSIDSSLYVVKEIHKGNDTVFVFKLNDEGKIENSRFYADQFLNLRGPRKAASSNNLYFIAESQEGNNQLIMKTNQGLRLPCIPGQSYKQPDKSRKLSLDTFANYRLLNIKLPSRNVRKSWESFDWAFNVQCGTRLYPKARLPEDTVVCDQSAIRLSPGPDTNVFQYQWNTGATRPKITVDTSGWYHVSITHKGCTARDSIKINFIDKRKSKLPADTTICKGDSLAIKVKSASYPYRWQQPMDSTDTTIQKGNVLKHYAKTEGHYKFYQKGYPACAVDTLKLDVYDPPTVASPDSAQICPNDSFDLSPVLQDPNQFQWVGPSGRTITDSGVKVQVQKSGAYTLYKKLPFCPVDSFKLQHFLLPEADAGPDTTLCYNQSYTMQGSGGITYHWTPATYLSEDSVAKPEATLPEKQAYRLTVSNQRGCSDTDRVMLDVRPPLDVTLSAPETVCAHESVTLEADGQGGIPADYQFQWTLPNETGGQLRNRFSRDRAVKVTLTDGCSPAATDSTFVQVQQAPQADYTLKPADTVFLSNKLNLSTRPDTGAAIQWFVDGTLIGETPRIGYAVEDPGRHAFKLIKRTSKKCADTAEGDFYGKLDLKAYIPNSFSPNDDGLNDSWRIEGSGIQRYRFQIYNRWGALIYETDKGLKPEWQGVFQSGGQPVPVGTYLYRATIVDKAGYQHYRHGTLQVIR